jgi:hypothetical protein
MIWRFNEKRFPHASPFERRRRVTASIIALVAGIVLVAVVVLLTIGISRVR